MSSRNTQSFLEDVLRSAEAIQGFIADATFEEYAANLMLRSAVERQLQILTEAAIRLRGTAERLCPGIDWKAVRGFGNFLRHEYDYVSDHEIWTSIHQELPELVRAVSAALHQLVGAQPGDPPMTRLGILLSGRGSNFLAIHRAIASGLLPAVEIAVVLSNKSAAPGLAAARELGIPARHIPTAGLPPETRDQPFLDALHEAKVDLVCLAGYMRIISPAFVAAYPDRILNVHPSLLPSFPGLEAQTQALQSGAKVTGCTVHFVDEAVDHGVIVLQRAVRVLDHDTPDTLAARILIEEHRAYPEAIARVLSGDYEIQGRRYLRRTASF